MTGIMSQLSPLQTHHGLWQIREGIISRLEAEDGRIGWVYCGGVGNEARPSYGERGIFRAMRQNHCRWKDGDSNHY